MYLYLLVDTGEFFTSRDRPTQDELSAIDDGDIRIFTLRELSFVELNSDFSYKKVKTRDDL